ncbi:hypothetical protein [Lacisediminihabitans changchengi]|uniref:Uncharacterized protein n=1 Tax=Lacisediminihabitans changchengi TaxID=2787634 RepID=A0A934SQE0_9MICO|nr:hypothetical protein [Lacisediminihabitans changchengi]MBK4347138.1 hypothetical protein [Lacisediminihabitans changchengi]
MLVLALSGIGAARAEPAALCLPIIMPCAAPSTSPSPTPTSSSTPSSPPKAPGIAVPIPLLGVTPGQPAVPAVPGTPGETPPPTPVADDSAPTFTLPAATLGGSSITISGLHGIAVVTVPLADGSRATALKVSADDVVVTDFVLDVRKSTGPSLVSTSDRMELNGNVQVYLDSATATLGDGTALNFGAATPPPGNELPPELLRVSLGLVGVTANSISFANSHQQLKD